MFLAFIFMHHCETPFQAINHEIGLYKYVYSYSAGSFCLNKLSLVLSMVGMLYHYLYKLPDYSLQKNKFQ